MSQFELRLEDNIFQLHKDLVSGIYTHDVYTDFYTYDPKRRHIHKASVHDRIVHQALFRVLYPIFDAHFIYDSYSSRNDHGTHLGVQRAYVACRKVSKNWKRKTWVLKCDVRKFFDSIDHNRLLALIRKKVSDTDTLALIDLLFKSFEKEKGKGLPLGNVTSQLFANVYLNELDQFAKHVLKAKYYFRYCDDFIFISENYDVLVENLEKIKSFLQEKLLLKLHPQKVEIRPLAQGIDFLGYVILPHMIVLRTRTKRRILHKIRTLWEKVRMSLVSDEIFHSVITSYIGMLSHCRAKKVESSLKRFLHLPHCRGILQRYDLF